MYDGDMEAFFADSNIGIVDTVIGFWGDTTYLTGLYLDKPGTKSEHYKASQKIPTGFLMATVPLHRRLELYGGARYEHTFMEASKIEVSETNPEDDSGAIDRGDWFPSAGAKFGIIDNMNFRVSYGKTIARPSMTEFAPLTQEFPKDGKLLGNVNLKSTIINNVDLRWEWYFKAGSILAISGFYKKLINPIEYQDIEPENNQRQFKNVSEGKTQGLELEAKGRLWDNRISLSGNFTLVHSEVQIDSAEYFDLQQHDSTALKTRPLWGQSPYLVNITLSFDDIQRMRVDSIKVGGAIFYNVFGKRLAKVAYGPTPDVYELPRHELNLSTYMEIKKIRIKFGFKNLINTPYKEVMNFEGKEYVTFSHSKGRKISMTISRKF